MDGVVHGPTEAPRAPLVPGLVVQKYGGTSLGDLDRIRKVATRIQRAVDHGHKVAVTVSAMGHATDRLVATARELNPRPDRRELDMLMATGEQVSIALLCMALHHQGVRASSFTGAQAGLLTDGVFGSARILQVDPGPLVRSLQSVDVAVIAGFQGVDGSGELTTLGRGGSDTTAVAIAAALGARECEIFTDTDGVYTTDPHLIPEAAKLQYIDYDEMLELASQGARVLHPRSVWYARRYRVRVHVRSSFSFHDGTIVAALPRAEEPIMKTDRPVTGVALDDQHARINVVGVPDVPGVAARIFGALGAASVNVDMIIQGVPGAGDSRQQLSFIVPHDLSTDAVEAVRPVLRAIGGGEVSADDGIAKLSIVGVAIGSTPGVAGRLFAAVASVGANIEMITTSEVRISVVIPKAYAERALRAVHDAFDLGTASAA
jgi:aspartate kinase